MLGKCWMNRLRFTLTTASTRERNVVYIRNKLCPRSTLSGRAKFSRFGLDHSLCLHHWLSSHCGFSLFFDLFCSVSVAVSVYLCFSYSLSFHLSVCLSISLTLSLSLYLNSFSLSSLLLHRPTFFFLSLLPSCSPLPLYLWCEPTLTNPTATDLCSALRIFFFYFVTYRGLHMCWAIKESISWP